MKKIDKTALIEWSKEVARWSILLVIAWFISETLKQSGFIPDKYDLHVWVFTYTLPIRSIFILGLTGLSRFVDKLLHAKEVPTPLDLKFIK